MRKFFAALLILLWAHDARAAVALDAAGSWAVNNTAGTSASYTGITVGSNPNTVLVCFVGWYANISAPSVTWNGVSMAEVGSLVNKGNLAVASAWVLFNPASGAKTLAMSWTTSSTTSFGCASFWGAAQVTSLYGAANATGAATPQSVTCGPVNGGDIAVNYNVENGGTPASPTQTLIGSSNTGTNGDSAASYAQRAGGNLTFQWTQGGGQFWASLCAGILAAHSLSGTGAGP